MGGVFGVSRHRCWQFSSIAQAALIRDNEVVSENWKTCGIFEILKNLENSRD